MRGIEVCGDCTAEIFNPSDNLSDFDARDIPSVQQAGKGQIHFHYQIKVLKM